MLFRSRLLANEPLAGPQQGRTERHDLAKCTERCEIEDIVIAVLLRYFTGVRIGAPSFFRKTTRNFAGIVLLALRLMV